MGTTKYQAIHMDWTSTSDASTIDIYNPANPMLSSFLDEKERKESLLPIPCQVSAGV